MSWFWFACLFLFIFLLLASDWFESSNFFSLEARRFLFFPFFFVHWDCERWSLDHPFGPLSVPRCHLRAATRIISLRSRQQRLGGGRGAVARALTTQTRQKAKQKSTQQKERSILLWYMSKLYLKDMRWAVEHTQTEGQAAPPPSHPSNSTTTTTTTTTTTLAASSSSFDSGLEFIIRYRAQRDYIFL